MSFRRTGISGSLMGVLVALQGLKDYWQYGIIAALLVFIVVQKSWINSLKYEVAKAQIVIEQYKAETAAQEKRYNSAEKEVQVMKKQQDREVENIRKQPVPEDCKKAVEWGIKQAMKIS